MMSGVHVVGMVETLTTLQDDMAELATNLTFGMPSFPTIVIDVVVVVMAVIPATTVASLSPSSAMRGQRAGRVAARRPATPVVVAG
jgi:hypothetical protein